MDVNIYILYIIEREIFFFFLFVREEVNGGRICCVESKSNSCFGDIHCCDFERREDGVLNGIPIPMLTNM